MSLKTSNNYQDYDTRVHAFNHSVRGTFDIAEAALNPQKCRPSEVSKPAFLLEGFLPKRSAH